MIFDLTESTGPWLDPAMKRLLFSLGTLFAFCGQAADVPMMPPAEEAAPVTAETLPPSAAAPEAKPETKPEAKTEAEIDTKIDVRGTETNTAAKAPTVEKAPASAPAPAVARVV